MNCFLTVCEVKLVSFLSLRILRLLEYGSYFVSFNLNFRKET
jgi:hypothetical protein